MIWQKDYDSQDMEHVAEMILADENVRNSKPDSWVGLSKTSELVPCYNEREPGWFIVTIVNICSLQNILMKQFFIEKIVLS